MCFSYPVKEPINRVSIICFIHAFYSITEARYPLKPTETRLSRLLASIVLIKTLITLLMKPTVFILPLLIVLCLNPRIRSGASMIFRTELTSKVSMVLGGGARTLGLLVMGLFLVSCSQSLEGDNKFVPQDLSGSSVVVDTSYWETQCQACHKTEDINTNASLRGWANRSEESLADYIEVAMPYSNPSVCEGDCALQTARYMQAILTNKTIVNSDDAAMSDAPNSNEHSPSESIVIPEPYQTLCAACHVPEKIVSEFSAWKAQSVDELTSYIEMTMPFANAPLCVGECATQTAQYILATLDDSSVTTGGGPNPGSGTDTGSGSDSQDNEVTLPLQPSSLALSHSMVNNNITLTWQDNSSNETSFTLWKKTGEGSWSAYQSLAENQTEYVDTSLQNTTIAYRVSSTNSEGSSALSDTVSIDLTPITTGESCNASTYVAGTIYISEQIVKAEDRYFSCKPGVAAWCSSAAAWAYEPIKGLYWSSAWAEVDSCMADPSEITDTVTLNAPTILSAAVVETSVAITWLDNATGETNYLVEKAVSNGSWALIATLPADSENFVDSDNGYGSQVQYRIYAKTASSNGSRSTTNLLTFADSVFDADAYYASDCAACHGARGEGTSNGALQVSGFQTSELSLQELVDSIDASMPYGNADACTDDCANDIAGYIFAEFMGSDTAPAAVTNVFVGANSMNTAINISWSDNSNNETGFRVEKSVNDLAFTTWQTVAANESSLNDIDVSIGSTYRYRISAFNTTDVSLAVTSNQVLLEASVTLPAKPTVLSVTMNEAKALLIWADNANNEQSFVIQRRKNRGNWGESMAVAANATSYQDATVIYGNIYGYRVLASNEAADSTWSDEIELDLSSAINRSAYDSNCAGCHKDGGIAIDLLSGFAKQNWDDSDWGSFTSKVNTMNTSGCDADCKTNAAQYVWAETWGLALTDDIATHGRGVRGLRLLTSYEYLNTVEDVFGFTIPEEYLPADRNATEFTYATDAHAGVVIYDRLNEFLLLAEYIAENAPASSYGCSTSCNSSQLTTLLEKTFRRSVDTATLNEYTTFQSNYGREDLIASLLLSPWFLYRSELGVWNNDQQAYQLDNYEVATALSYQLWGTSPGTALLTKAKNNQLTADAQITAQVELMIGDERAAKHLVEFVRYYTRTQANLSEKPNLPYSTIVDMEAERDASVIYSLTQGSATLDELFNPGYTFVNSRLASHYGMSSVSGSTMRKITTDRNRGGILQQGILQIHNSDFTATSLVKRGKMIRENMMCQAMGVPSNVDPLSIQLPATAISTRERWNIITGPDASEGQCWSCHQLMNEPGSVLESYDAAGRYRRTETAYNDENTIVAITTEGVLRSNDSTEDLLSYTDSRDLSEYLANSRVGQDCFVDNYFRFSTGYEVDGGVQADVDQWMNQFRQGGNIWNMVRQTISSESFLYRTERN